MMTQPLVFAISTRASAWRTLDWWISTAHDAGALPLDIELTTALRRRRLGITSWRQALMRPEVASVWIRATRIGPPSLALSTEMLSPPTICTPHQTICLQHDAIADPKGDLDDAVASAARLRASLEPSTRVALAVTPINPGGGREHLVRLQALRLRAAEWDVDLALDLTGKLDETWEAEAAMLRMSKRLAVIRLGYPPPNAPGSTKWKLVRRILSAAVDVEFSGVVAIAPTVRPWRLVGSADAEREPRQSVADLRSDFRTRSLALHESSRQRGAR
ncbi:MAG: hypothetical protein ACRDJH_14105 [Thermomicrobiales bacterium]